MSKYYADFVPIKDEVLNYEEINHAIAQNQEIGFGELACAKIVTQENKEFYLTEDSNFVILGRENRKDANYF